MLTSSQQSHRPVDQGRGELWPKLEVARLGGATGTPVAGTVAAGGSGGADGGFNDAFIF